MTVDRKIHKHQRHSQRRNLYGQHQSGSRTQQEAPAAAATTSCPIECMTKCKQAPSPMELGAVQRSETQAVEHRPPFKIGQRHKRYSIIKCKEPMASIDRKRPSVANSLQIHFTLKQLPLFVQLLSTLFEQRYETVHFFKNMLCIITYKCCVFCTILDVL